MAGRTRIPAAASALVAVPVIALMLLRPARLLRAAAGTLLPAVCLGLGASFMRRSLLRRPGLALGARTLLPSVIPVLPATMPLLTITALSAILLAILLLSRGRACALLRLAVLVRPVAAVPAIASSMRPAVMRTPASTFRLWPAETPDLFKFGLRAFALGGSLLNGCVSIRRRQMSLGGSIPLWPSGQAFAAGLLFASVRRRRFGLNIADVRRNIIVRLGGPGSGFLRHRCNAARRFFGSGRLFRGLRNIVVRRQRFVSSLLRSRRGY